MAEIIIKEKAAGYYEFTIDGDVVYNNVRNDLTVDSTSGTDYCHFKTSNGAAIFQKQNILITDVTIINADDDEFNPTTIEQLYSQLYAIGYFDWINGGGSGSSTRFDELLDTFNYPANNGKVPVVDSTLLKLVPTIFHNISLFSQLQDVATGTLNAGMAGSVLGIAIIDGNPKIVISNSIAPAGGVAPAGQITLFDKGFLDGIPNDPTNAFIQPGDIARGLKDDGIWQMGVYKYGATDDQDWANYEIIEYYKYTPVVTP